MSAEMTRLERQAILAMLGFTQQQAELLAQGVTVEQLRGMRQLRQCEGASVAVMTEIAARIDRIEELEKIEA